MAEKPRRPGSSSGGGRGASVRKGKVEEDGSYNAGEKVYDPDTGKLRGRIKFGPQRKRKT